MSLYDYLLTQDGIITKESLLYPFEERGLQFGDGVYEVIRIYQGTFDLLEEHIDRLYRSAEAIRLEVPFAKDALIASLHQLSEKNDVQTDAKLYLQITRGSAPREHSFPDVPSNFYAYMEPSERPVSPLQQGVRAVLADDIRWDLCYIKSLNLLPNILAKQTAKEKGAFEAILHKNGTVTEGSSSNVFIIKDKILFTHPAAENILHGCVRSRVLALALKAGLQVKETAFTTDQLLQADEVFITSTTSEIMPVIEIEGSLIGNGKPGSDTRTLQLAYEKESGIQTTAFV
ncbi:D-amino-acid transaminase [Terribacillus saccharophilus]|uniref:D-alanine aminotransferase n=1 Tax=Terribacillus saccharophilus TaxID=361277 RepID=A0ABX4GX18_9BACI|nr:D-amino-acid transaminase [Terribacillus saccharophilus]PAD34916.1 D-amino-acid transaminase [Terribacillus saccharophilus]PAD95820.1 D-amino-acid transaminase [Terribacillus saccharophilus]PAD99388.1 D-amino-acid transaminase [Terribacillus saccharophilus]